MIESEVYKLSAGAYMRQLFPLYLKRRWWLFVLVALPFPVLAGSVESEFSLRSPYG